MNEFQCNINGEALIIHKIFSTQSKPQAHFPRIFKYICPLASNHNSPFYMYLIIIRIHPTTEKEKPSIKQYKKNSTHKPTITTVKQPNSDCNQIQTDPNTLNQIHIFIISSCYHHFQSPKYRNLTRKHNRLHLISSHKGQMLSQNNNHSFIRLETQR